MAKTRSQTASIPIKEEERKNTQLLHNASTTRTRNKITKRRTSKRQSSASIVRQIKLEEESDEKPALNIFPGKKKRSVVTEKQIEQLIDCVENKNMTVSAASRMVKIDYWTGAKYYNRYKKDPKKNSFSQKNSISIYTHDQIKTLFGYIIDDGMSLREASRTTNMTFSAVQAYYKRYTEDPNHNIPLSASELNKHNNACTQDQVKRLIHYIVKKNMSIQTASIKTNMGCHTARRYYERYLEDPNHKIPVPVKSGFSGRSITREQIEALIDYIVNDNMSIECASKKANMSERSGGRYYHLYLNDPNRQIPVPRENLGGFCQPCSQEQVTELIHSIVNDKMSLVAASIKTNMAVTTAKKYYDKYMDDPNQEVPVPHLKTDAKRLSQNQLSELMGYLVDDKMSLSAASKKAKVSLHTTRRYYNRYLQDPTHRIPSGKSNFGRRYTKPQIKKLIGYIVDDKMSIYHASLKTGMSEPTAKKYYTEYLSGATGTKKKTKVPEWLSKSRNLYFR